MSPTTNGKMRLKKNKKKKKNNNPTSQSLSKPHFHSLLDLVRTFLFGINLLTLSSRIHNKESAIHFLQTHGIIDNQRLCRNGHEINLSTSSDR